MITAIGSKRVVQQLAAAMFVVIVMAAAAGVVSAQEAEAVEVADEPTVAEETESYDVPTIAVYVTGAASESTSKTLGRMILDALTEDGMYDAAKRSDELVKQFAAEQAKVSSGKITDTQIKNIGKQFGADFVCVADLTSDGKAINISARIVDVKSGKAANMGRTTTTLEKPDDLKNAVEKLFDGDQETDTQTQQTAKQQSDPKAAGWKYVPGEILVKSKWAQRVPYNNKMPVDPQTGSLDRTGCWITAMAQIINYHKYPDSAYGTTHAWISVHSNVKVPVEALPPAVAIDWDNMADTYSKTSTETQKNAVSDLMRTVIMYKQYSGVLSSFIKNFGYDYRARLVYRKDFSSDPEWENLIRNQIDNGLPMWYHADYMEDGVKTRLADHAYVVDGYDATGKFHVNWGWSGTHNGFYTIPVNDAYKSLKFSASDPFRYSANQFMIINLKPAGNDPINKLIKFAVKGGTYKLEANAVWDTTATYEIAVMNDFTLDLNGHTLTINKPSGNGIKIDSGKTFTIKDSRSGGILNITGGNNRAGINTTDGTLVIESGTVKAVGRGTGAGIGGGNNGSGGNVIIKGGTVTAVSDSGWGAGIGGGNKGSGGNITISGGKVTAASKSGAGIGGGNKGSGGNITIKGGTVTVTADNGAGIGGGSKGSGDNIVISGGTINAVANKNGAGIGGGHSGSGGNITISGGTVSASINPTVNYAGAGIGGGYTASGGNITINGGTVTATGGSKNGAGIGDGYKGTGGKLTVGGSARVTNNGTLTHNGTGAAK